MGWESSNVVRFGLGPLLQGQTRRARLKNAYNFRNLQPLCLDDTCCNSGHMLVGNSGLIGTCEKVLHKILFKLCNLFLQVLL